MLIGVVYSKSCVTFVKELIVTLKNKQMKNLKKIALEILKRTYGANLTVSQVKEIFTIINEQPTMYKAEEVVLNLTR